MKSNRNFSKIYIPPEKLAPTLNNGDIVLFRSYDYDYINAYQFFLLNLIHHPYFTHIGIIYKNSQGNIFIIESNIIPTKCRLSNKVKMDYK